jgi:hypothetical protein
MGVYLFDLFVVSTRNWQLILSLIRSLFKIRLNSILNVKKTADERLQYCVCLFSCMLKLDISCSRPLYYQYPFRFFSCNIIYHLEFIPVISLSAYSTFCCQNIQHTCHIRVTAVATSDANTVRTRWLVYYSHVIVARRVTRQIVWISVYNMSLAKLGVAPLLNDEQVLENHVAHCSIWFWRRYVTTRL